MRARGRPQEPQIRGVRLLELAEGEQRVQRQGQVAWPAVAIVVVALAADSLRQRGGGRGEDAAAGAVDEELEGERAADDGIPPAPVVVDRRAPAPPVLDRGVQPA